MNNIYNLYVMNDIITNGYTTLVLNFFSLSSILCGIFVIVSKNPIVSVLFLIGLFLSVACYLIVLGLGFIGLSYLLVYVGAVSILFLFILMLINVRISELSSETSNSLPLAIVIGIYFNYCISQISPYGLMSYIYSIKNILYTNSLSYYINYFNIFGDKKSIFFVTSNAWDSNLAETSHIASIGGVIYTNYALWLLITSIILLLAMVGAIVITIKQKT